MKNFNVGFDIENTVSSDSNETVILAKPDKSRKRKGIIKEASSDELLDLLRNSSSCIKCKNLYINEKDHEKLCMYRDGGRSDMESRPWTREPANPHFRGFISPSKTRQPAVFDIKTRRI